MRVHTEQPGGAQGVHPQADEPQQPTKFHVGDLVHIEIDGAYVFDTPRPIERIETAPDGARWYYVTGSTSPIGRRAEGSTSSGKTAPLNK